MVSIKENKGLTLIELVVSMAIFGIIAVVFLSVFSSSIMWIFGAGDKGEAYSNAQQDIEESIASGDSYNSEDISLNFDGKEYSIRGGLVESTQKVNSKDSTLKTFVPMLPTITLNPIVRYEGDLSTSVSITGIDTSFNSSTIIELYDATGTTKIGPTIDPTVNNIKEAVFNVPTNLLNNDYIVRVTTQIIGEPQEVARAKYRIEQPKFIVVGSNDIFISSDGINWVDRYSLPNITKITGLKDISNNGINYVIAGNEGKTMISIENASWINKNILSGEHIMSVVWSPTFDKFYSVGINGGIYYLDSDLNWNSMVTGTTNRLNGIVSTSFSDLTNIVNTVGDDTILYTSTGSNWSTANISYEPSSLSDSLSLNSVASSYNLVVAVGDNGYIGNSSNGIDWTVNKILTNNINDVAYNRDLNEFLAVGDNNLIMRSIDGVNWTTISSPVADDFIGLHTQGLELIIVGENGNVLYDDNISSINFSSSNLGQELEAVSGK